MPIESIISQPVTNSIYAAYRPVVIRVAATRTDDDPRPPVVYCDVYFNNIFYKTISKSQYIQLNDDDSEWQFDIQDAVQEYLSKFLAVNGGGSITEAPPLVTPVLCKLRSSGYDGNGFIQHEGTAPIQGTGDNDPVAGTGTSTNIFYVVNATLQHTDNQDLASHLSHFKKRTWATTTWPLTHRPDTYRVCIGDSDYFPILHGGANPLSCIVLKYQYKGQSSYASSTNCNMQACTLVTGIDVDVIDNGNDTQTFTFTFDPIDVVVSNLNIQYRISGSSDPWTDNNGLIASPRQITLPMGLYDFRFVTSGDCITQVGEELTAQGLSGDVCSPVGIVGSPELPDAVEDEVYNFSFNLTGTPPHSLTNIVKPDWMTISITGNTVNFTGIPETDDIDTDVEVSFEIYNCGDVGETVEFSDTIDVTAAAGCTPVSIDGGAPSLPDAVAGVPYSYNIDLLGSATFHMFVTSKPSWMTIAIVGSQVQLTGMPDPTHVGEGIVINFTVINCGGANNVNVNDTINVLAGVGFENMSVSNFSGGDSIDSVASGGDTFYFIISGAFPVENAEAMLALLTDNVTAAIDVDVTVAAPGKKIRLLKNGLEVASVDTPASGSYAFAVVTFTTSDFMEIVMENI